MRFRRHNGFTLIELLVVMIVILILVASLVTAVLWVIDKAKINSTSSLINRLEAGVKAYAAVFKNKFPPQVTSIPGVSGTINAQASSCLYYYLGFPWKVTEGFSQSSTSGQSLSTAKTVGPFVDFKGGDLKGGVFVSQTTAVYIIDAYGNEISYINPGGNHITPPIGTAPGYKDNSAFVDIISNGPDGINGNSDDITNFTRAR